MEERDDYRQRMEAELRELTVKMLQLETKLEKTEAEVRLAQKDRFADLKARKEELEKKLEGIKDASEDAWQDIKNGMDTSIREIKAALEKAANRFT